MEMFQQYKFTWNLCSDDPDATVQLTHSLLVDSSSVIWWTSPFVILGVFGLYFVAFILFLMENPVSKQCRHLCAVWSGSELFDNDPFTGFLVRMS